MTNDMKNLDLSEIDPLKWAEVRRRANVIERFLEINNPKAADRGRFGAMLDLGSLQFSNLVRAWELHADARSLSPGVRGRKASKISRSKSGGVDPRAREIARGVIAELAGTTTLNAVVAAVTARCTAADVDPPSRMTIWYLGMEAKGATGDAAHEPVADAILVARAVLKLPVDMGIEEGIMFPDVTVAVEMPSKRIIDITMDHPSGAPDVEFIAATLQRGSKPIEVDTIVLAALAHALPYGTAFVPVPPGGTRKTLANTLGRFVGRLELAYKPLVAHPDRFMQSAKDRAPSRTDAEVALRFARDRHNADIAAAAVSIDA